MRFRFDLLFQGIMRRMHLGVNTVKDIETINAVTAIDRHYETLVVDKEPTEEYFAPFVVGLNQQRCEYQRHSVINYCIKYKAILYEIEAVPSKTCHTDILRRLSILDDDYTDKVCLKFQFYIGMPIMITKRIPALEVIWLFFNYPAFLIYVITQSFFLNFNAPRRCYVLSPTEHSDLLLDSNTLTANTTIRTRTRTPTTFTKATSPQMQ